ncbi:MAG: AsmA family protein [Rhodospirillales bacterium]|nr:AsmA family protein [Rhodospirillales bacterium]
MKKILWTLGVVLVLLIGGVLIGPGLVDWNKYKEDIQAQAKTATGRDLVIKGDISITVLPAPALVASDVTLTNAKGAAVKNMVALKLLEVRIKMAPLLAGRVEVERVKLVNPVIELEVLADGKKNWEFETGPANTALVPPTKAKDASGQGKKAGPVDGKAPGTAFVLDSFTIENGTLIYRDAKGGIFERVEKINANVAAASLAGPFESSGEAMVRGTPLSYGVNVGEFIHGRTIPFNLRLGVTSADAKVQINGTLVGLEDQPKVKGKVKGEGASLARLIQAVGPKSALPGFLGQAFSFDGAVTAAADGADVAGLNFRLGSTQASGDVTATLNKTMAVKVRMAANRIDMDKWLSLPPVDAPSPAKGGGAKAPKAEAPVAAGQTGSGAGPGVDSGAFALPKNISASLGLTAEAITFRGGVIRNGVVNAELANGEATISQISAQFPGGSDLAIFGFLTAENGKPRFEGELETTVNDLRGVLRWLGEDMKGIGPERLRKLNLATRVIAVPEQLQLAGLDLQFDSSRLTGGVALALTKRPSFGADLTLDRINLDAYLPPATPKPAKKTKQAQDIKGTKKTATTKPQEKAPKVENPFSALKVLTEVDANLKVRVKNLVFRGSRIKDVTMDGTLYNGDLELRRLGVAEMAGAQATVTGVLKGLGGIPEASPLSFDMKAGDLSKLLNLAGMDGAVVPKGLGAVNVSGKINGKLLAPKLDVKLEGAGALGRLQGQIEGLAGIPTAKGLKFSVSAGDATRLLKLAGIEGKGAVKQFGKVVVEGAVDGNLLQPTVTLTLNGAGGTVSLSGPVNTLTPTDMADLSLKASYPNLKRLIRALGVAYTPAGKIGGLDIQAKLRGGPKALTISGLTAKAGAVQMTGDIAVGLEGPRPAIKANLSAGAIVIDPFLPAQKSASLWDGLIIRPAARRKPSSGRWSRNPIDLSGLGTVDAEIAFKTPLLQFEKYQLRDAALALKVAKGRVNAEKLTGVLFGGALHAAGSATATNRPRIETAFALENMNVGQALKAFAGTAAATGKLSMKARLQTAGENLAGMVSGLSGDGNIRMRGVDVKQGNTGTAMAGALGLVTALNQVGGLLGGASKGSGLVDISGSFDITGGIARTGDMKVASAVGNGAATGSIDLPRWLIDVKGNVQLAPNLLTAFLSSRTGGRAAQAVPFTVRGKLDAPTINLDTSKLTGGGLPIPGVDKLLKKAPKGVGSILQGILGGGAQQQGTSGSTGGSTGGSEPPPPPSDSSRQQQKIDPVDLLKGLFKRR